MDVFSSTWLIVMLAKSSKTPKGRILSLFDILADWLNAPDIHLDMSLNGDAHSVTSPKFTAQVSPHAPLVVYLRSQAVALNAHYPDMLAEQIVLIACNAAQQQTTWPNSFSLVHAKKSG